MITLGVADLAQAASFCESVLATPPNRSYDRVVFIERPGSWLALSQEINPARSGFIAISQAAADGSISDRAYLVQCRDGEVAPIAYRATDVSTKSRQQESL